MFAKLIRFSASGELVHNDDTTARILAVRDERRVALYFTGAPHAGENLNEVLRRRAADLPPPVQMCDAPSRKDPAEFQTIIANCLTHARREKFSPEERLKYHQGLSGPALESLCVWLDVTVSERLVGPNSALGAAISYPRGHSSRLTLFLRQVRAPLDNNICERALKKQFCIAITPCTIGRSAARRSATFISR